MDSCPRDIIRSFEFAAEGVRDLFTQTTSETAKITVCDKVDEVTWYLVTSSASGAADLIASHRCSGAGPGLVRDGSRALIEGFCRGFGKVSGYGDFLIPSLSGTGFFFEFFCYWAF